jgi:CheY-like chemotaxis protein
VPGQAPARAVTKLATNATKPGTKRPSARRRNQPAKVGLTTRWTTEAITLGRSAGVHWGTQMSAVVVRLVSSPPPPPGDAESDHTYDANNGARRAATVLVVEDEILVRMTLADYLRDSGLRVLEAANAEEAQAILRAGEAVEVVFSDVNMPGMDGVALARWISAAFPDVQTILTSGDTANRANAKAAAAVFLEKPYAFENLERLIKRLIAF